MITQQNWNLARCLRNHNSIRCTIFVKSALYFKRTSGLVNNTYSHSCGVNSSILSKSTFNTRIRTRSDISNMFFAELSLHIFFNSSFPYIWVDAIDLFNNDEWLFDDIFFQNSNGAYVSYKFMNVNFTPLTKPPTIKRIISISAINGQTSGDAPSIICMCLSP